MDGVYTSAQAAEGREIYVRACSQCHVLDYYAGEIMQAWEGVPVFDLYDQIRTNMPENNPGSLRSREYVAMMAYILELNGMPTGEEPLSGRSSVLKNIVFQWRDEP
jgi:mono/diheme cytochrome c family protein